MALPSTVRLFQVIFCLTGLIVPSVYSQKSDGVGTLTADLFMRDEEAPVLFEDLEAGRVCRPPLPAESVLLQQALMPQPPHSMPFENSIFDLVVVVQRHGVRRSMVAASNTKFYKNARAGQLLPQGAYQLRVSGMEVRYYMEKALGSTKIQPLADDGKLTSEDIYSKTLGLDITQDCALEGLERCSSALLAGAVAEQLPADSVYVRANGIPRTRWSAIKFLEGFYGLPSGCTTSTQQLLSSSRKVSSGVICPERSVCDASATTVEAKKTLTEVCVTLKLPCIITPPLEEDGMSCGAASSKETFDEAWASYKHLPPERNFVHPDTKVQNAKKLAAELLSFSDTDALSVGEMAYSELMSGEPKPVQAIAEWYEKHENAGGDVALEEGKKAEVPSYSELIELLLKEFHYNGVAMYGDDDFSKYTVSPLFLLLNSMFRARAFGREEDWTELRVMMRVLGGFEDFADSDIPADDFQVATQKLKLLLISLQDYLLIASQHTLGFGNEKILPFAIKIMYELTHVPDNSFRGTPEQRLSKPSDEVSTVETLGNDGTFILTTTAWPSNNYFVRVMMGVPGEDIRPMQLPWCENKTACPLNRWLDYTYQKILGHTLIDRVSKFRRKYVAERSKA